MPAENPSSARFTSSGRDGIAASAMLNSTLFRNFKKGEVIDNKEVSDGESEKGLGKTALVGTMPTGDADPLRDNVFEGNPANTSGAEAQRAAMAAKPGLLTQIEPSTPTTPQPPAAT